MENSPVNQQSAAAPPLLDAELQRLEALLDSLPAPLQPLDVSALDGYLCGVLLQPQRPPPSRWMPFVSDVDGRAPAAGTVADSTLEEIAGLVRRRHAELDSAIGQRQWFDPWIYELDESDQVSESVLPWVAGFAAAMEHFPALMALTDPELVEPLALIFMHFDAEDLEDAEALLAVIETLEPPSDLPDAVQDLVRALMLIADVTRPRAISRTNKAAPARGTKTRPPPRPRPQRRPR